MNCLISRAFLATLLTCLAILPIASAQTPESYKSDQKYLSAMADARHLERQQQYFFAINAYRKANKVAGNKDAACLDRIFNLQIKMGSYKDAAKTAEELENVVQSANNKSVAESDRGYALFLQAGEKGKPELLKAADESFKASIADNPKNSSAHFFDGKVLARLGQIEAARDEFKACVNCLDSKDPSYLRAQHFVENPELSLARMAPAFTVTALDGSKFNLDAMGGRVVLIDFWATWCGPCNAELPHIKKIAREFAGEPLVIISVSWDSDEAKWKDFINKNEMTWVQYRDADHSLSNSFGINAIPHYFTIDSDGVLTAEMLGEGSDVEGKLKKLIAKAKAANSSTRLANAGD